LQPLLLTKREVIATLAHRVARAQAAGLPYEQATERVGRELHVDPAKIVALVPPSTREAA